MEDRFSGGVAAGDFNNDGFPDLYVANIGPNRLFQNRGDGTFAEVTAPALPDSDQWTTSCAIADLNLDGIPDLFDVNYLDGNGLHELICQTSAGPRVCTPLAFAAAKDRLCLGVGDGTFRDLTEAAGLGLPDGNGLGLLIRERAPPTLPSLTEGGRISPSNTLTLHYHYCFPKTPSL